jgi:hypothetical protein
MSFFRSNFQHLSNVFQAMAHPEQPINALRQRFYFDPGAESKVVTMVLQPVDGTEQTEPESLNSMAHFYVDNPYKVRVSLKIPMQDDRTGKLYEESPDINSELIYKRGYFSSEFKLDSVTLGKRTFPVIAGPMHSRGGLINTLSQNSTRNLEGLVLKLLKSDQPSSPLMSELDELATALTEPYDPRVQLSALTLETEADEARRRGLHIE